MVIPHPASTDVAHGGRQCPAAMTIKADSCTALYLRASGECLLSL